MGKERNKDVILPVSVYSGFSAGNNRHIPTSTLVRVRSLFKKSVCHSGIGADCTILDPYHIDDELCVSLLVCQTGFKWASEEDTLLIERIRMALEKGGDAMEILRVWAMSKKYGL